MMGSSKVIVEMTPTTVYQVIGFNFFFRIRLLNSHSLTIQISPVNLTTEMRT